MRNRLLLPGSLYTLMHERWHRHTAFVTIVHGTPHGVFVPIDKFNGMATHHG